MESNPEPVYEEFDVFTEWVHEAADDTLIAHLAGFRKEQIKVQITVEWNLRISGARPVGGNKFIRFSMEIPIPSDCDQNNIKASFKDGILRVKHAKLIVPADIKQKQAKPSAESDQKHAPQPPRPADVPQKQNNAVEEAPGKASMEKRRDGIAEETDNVSERALDKEKEMKDKSNDAANEYDKPMEKEKKSWDQEEKTSVQDASEKEIVEPKKLHGTDKYQIGISMARVKYKQVLHGVAKGIKNPRMMMNMVLAVLLVVVLAVYLRNAIRSLGNS